jgi:hypothetical protein
MLAIVNLTPVEARAPGFGLLVSPALAGEAPPGSNVNFSPGSVDPNTGVAVTGSAGEVCFANSGHGDVELVADVQALLLSHSFTATDAPVRRVDTRVDLGGGRLTPGETRCFEAAGTPGDVAFVNLTPVNASAPGFGLLATSTMSSTSPLAAASAASSVNFRPGSIDPNIAAARIGSDQKVCFVNSEHASIDLIVDQLFTLYGRVARLDDAPVRRIDTRLSPGTALAPGERRCFDVDRAPGDLDGGVGDLAVVNLTPVNATAPGFGVLVSSNVTETPIASSVNFSPGSVDPNVAFATIGSDGNVCFINSDLASVDLVADLITTINRLSVDTASVAGRFDTRSPVIASAGCTPVACAALTAGGSFLRSASADGPWEHQRFVAHREGLSGIACMGVWCFFHEPDWPFSPATPISYGAAWGFNDSLPAGPGGWAPLRGVPRGAKACPSNDVCLSFSDQLGPYGLTMWPILNITRNGGVHWSPIDLSATQPQLQTYPCSESPVPGISCEARPSAMFTNVACRTPTRCTASFWTGEFLMFSTSDGWATVDIDRLPPTNAAP